MAKAIWNGAVIAESDDTVVVEGNHYFPVDSVNSEYLVETAWYYPAPSGAAQEIQDRIAFWRGVKVVETNDDTGRTGLRALLMGEGRAA